MYYTNICILAGHQFILGKGFALDIFVGGGIKYNIYYFSQSYDSTTNTYSPETTYQSGRKLVVGLNLGWAF